MCYTLGLDVKLSYFLNENKKLSITDTDNRKISELFALSSISKPARRSTILTGGKASRWLGKPSTQSAGIH